VTKTAGCAGLISTARPLCSFVYVLVCFTMAQILRTWVPGGKEVMVMRAARVPSLVMTRLGMWSEYPHLVSEALPFF
jgi:Fe2+ transport system protein B